MVAMIIGFVVMTFFAYMFIRNSAVADARIGFIKYFYEEDLDGDAAGKRFHDHYRATTKCFGSSGCGLCQNSIQPIEIEIATSDHAIIPPS